MSNELKISWKKLENLVERLVERISKDDFDYLICIANGGSVLGRLVRDHTGLPLGTITASTYRKGERKPRDDKVIIGNLSITEPLKGRVLLLDDLVDTGITMKAICNNLKENYDIKIIETGVLFKKPQTIFQPDYWVEETSSWIVFPYEKNEFLRTKEKNKN